MSIKLRGGVISAQVIPAIPVFAILMSVVFLGERLSGVQILGAGIVILSTVFVMAEQGFPER